MNKKFIYAALASLAMVGCAKTEGVKPVKQAETIAFRPTNTSATRAETDYNALADAGFFSVTFQTPGPDGVNQLVFAKDLTKPAAGTTWDSGEAWPGNSNSVKSFNIGPVNSAGYIGKSKSKVLKNDATPLTLPGVAQSDDDVFTTVNIGGAKGTTPSATYTQKADKNDNRNINKAVDVVVGTTSGLQQDNSGVLALDFKHIYSQVCISATNKSTAYTVKVLGAGIANVKSTGTFNFPLDKTVEGTELPATSAAQNPSWTGLDNPVVYGNAWNITKIENTGDVKAPFAGQKSAITLTTEPVDVLHPEASTEGIYLIPQVLDLYKVETNVKTATYLKVFVQITRLATDNTVATQVFPEEPGKFGSVLVPIPDKFTSKKTNELLAGKKYKFVINFFGNTTGGNTPGAGYVDPNPADNGTAKGTPGDNKRTGGGDPSTTNQDGTNPDIVSNPTTKTSGNPIITTEHIKFDVSVDPWTEDQTITIDL